jgi:hypothetical protein
MSPNSKVLSINIVGTRTDSEVNWSIDQERDCDRGNITCTKQEVDHMENLSKIDFIN